MQAEIITIGDEILLGQTINTNAAWMGKHLYEAGVEVQQVTTITDREDHILAELKEATSRVDVVLITGGLGPTQDDITKDTLCKFFNTRAVLNPEVLRHVESFFVERKLPMLPSNIKQAEMPEAADVLMNTRGTAMGMWFERENKIVVSMPGVPHEMETMMRDEIIPRLEKRFPDGGGYYSVVQTIGKGESFIAQQLHDWESRIRAEGLSLAYLPSLGSVRLRVSGRRSEKQRIENEVNILVDILGDIVFARGEITLSETIGDMLRQHNLKLAVAESCSGGYLAHDITAVPGSSDYFLGGVVSYSNALKESLLGVRSETLATHGAVSKEVVCEMADGIRNRTGADVALATSGIAGPGGATDDKPVGQVWVGIAHSGGTTGTVFQFGRRRDRNIRMSSTFALNELRKYLMTLPLEAK